jgi:hypothetical protein
VSASETLKSAAFLPQSRLAWAFAAWRASYSAPLRGVTTVCLDCGVSAQWALIDESGEMLGIVCIECEHKRRLGAAVDITDVVTYLRAEADRALATPQRATRTITRSRTDGSAERHIGARFPRSVASNNS